ncbi:MAG: hypothetical protein WEE50_04670 [Chloroflexota bacterium]
MIQDRPRQSDGANRVLLDDADGEVRGVTRVVVGPVARLRSPVLEHRPIELLPPDDDRPTVLLPPLRAFIGPSGLALLVAAPVLLLAGWQLALVAAVIAIVSRAIDRVVGRATFSFGDGFLPFRSQPGWPQGVQEEDDVRWDWSAVSRNPGAPG